MSVREYENRSMSAKSLIVAPWAVDAISKSGVSGGEDETGGSTSCLAAPLSWRDLYGIAKNGESVSAVRAADKPGVGDSGGGRRSRLQRASR